MSAREPSSGAGEVTSATVATHLHYEDPYAAFDDLMCVVEALCPVWPQRAVAATFDLVILL